MKSAVHQFLSNYPGQQELIVVFYAPWFRPSVKAKEDWELRDKNGIPIVILNADEETALVEELKLACIPAVYRFKNGEIVERTTGG